MAHEGEETSVAFVVTGFGPFRGVSDNPTTTIVNALPSHLADLATAAAASTAISKEDEDCDDATGSARISCSNAKMLASNTTTHIFETSAQDVKRTIDDLYGSPGGGNINMTHTGSTDVVLLHLGVNYLGVNFQVERAAYNDASFRVPDERGFQPKGECIISEELNEGGCLDDDDDVRRTAAPPYGHKLSTTLNVPSLVHKMSTERGYGDCVKVSSDPGRFVCNYAYCYSLHKASRHNETAAAAALQLDEGAVRAFPCETVHSLFLHVPPFRVVKMEKQIDFVCDLMDLISAELAKLRAQNRR